MQPAPKIDGANRVQAVDSVETLDTPTQETLEAPKKESINDIIRKYWEKYAKSQGIDPNNPPKSANPRPVPSFVGQRCGHPLVVKQMEEMLKRAKEAKIRSSDAPLPQPQGLPGPMELAQQQFCGQHHLAQGKERKNVKALKE